MIYTNLIYILYKLKFSKRYKKLYLKSLKKNYIYIFLSIKKLFFKLILCLSNLVKKKLFIQVFIHGEILLAVHGSYKHCANFYEKMVLVMIY